jgi:hypothetical protein
MRRLGGYLIAALLTSLTLVWFALAVFWLRSHWRSDVVMYAVSSEHSERPPHVIARTFLLLSGDGGIGIAEQWNVRFTKSDPKPPSAWTVATPAVYPQPWYCPLPYEMHPTRPTPSLRIGTGRVPTPSVDRTPDQNSDAELAIRSLSPHRELPLPGANLALREFRGSVPYSIPAGFLPITPLFPAPSGPLPPAHFRFLAYQVQSQAQLDWSGAVVLPYWSIMAVMTPALALSWFLHTRQVRRRRWLSRGCCVRCGYDLRASSDTCPECGTPVPAAHRTTVQTAPVEHAF